MKYISTAAAVFFMMLFTYAACSKLMDFSAFRLQLLQSPFVTRFAGPISWVLPLIELVISLLLLVSIQKPSLRLAGLLASLFLMSMFTTYIAMMLNFSFFIPCSCGGILSSMSWHQHLTFNIAILLLAAAGIVWDPGQPRAAGTTWKTFYPIAYH